MDPLPPVSSHARPLSSLVGTKSDFAPYTESRRLAAVSQLLSSQYFTEINSLTSIIDLVVELLTDTGRERVLFLTRVINCSHHQRILLSYILALL